MYWTSVDYCTATAIAINCICINKLLQYYVEKEINKRCVVSLFFSRYAADGEEQTVLESMRDYLLNTIQKTFEVGVDQAECLYQELLQCTRNKNLVDIID